jgi:hypothetical protein
MFDYLHILNDTHSIKADQACSVAGNAQILDLGAGMVEGKMVVDVVAIEIADDDEIYKITLQGSNSADFASGIVDLAELTLGAAEVIGGDVDSEVGRHTVPFSTRKKGVNYRYVRGYVDVSGTVETGISFSARLQPAVNTLTRVTPTVAVLTTTTAG